MIFEKDEVLKDDGKPYAVFTPYSRKWKAKLNDFYLKSYPLAEYTTNFLKQAQVAIPSFKEMGLEAVGLPFPSAETRKNITKKYKEQRGFPVIDGTSRLSVHLRFGTISIRDLVREAQGLSEGFLNELIWRDFYH